MHVHITGASGAGVTTLGAALAARCGLAHLDTDDFYWLPTTPPFRDKRPRDERVALLTAAMAEAASGWVLSGSIGAWGDPLLRRFDLVVFVETPTPVRLARLRAREAATFGAEQIAPGGEHHAVFVEFLEWAAGYDDGIFTGRSRARHEAWLAAVPCPVLRVAGTDPPAELAAAVESAWRDACNTADWTRER